MQITYRSLAALILTSSRPCALGAIYPWPFVVWFGAVIFFLKRRAGFQLQVLNVMELRNALKLAFLPAILLWLAAAIVRIVAWAENTVPGYYLGRRYYYSVDPNGEAFIAWNWSSLIFAVASCMWISLRTTCRAGSRLYKKKYAFDYSQYP